MTRRRWRSLFGDRRAFSNAPYPAIGTAATVSVAGSTSSTESEVWLDDGFGASSSDCRS